MLILQIGFPPRVPSVAIAMNSWLPRDGAIIAVDHCTDNRNGSKFEDNRNRGLCVCHAGRARAAADDDGRARRRAPKDRLGAGEEGPVRPEVESPRPAGTGTRLIETLGNGRKLPPAHAGPGLCAAGQAPSHCRGRNHDPARLAPAPRRTLWGADQPCRGRPQLGTCQYPRAPALALALYCRDSPLRARLALSASVVQVQ